MISNNTINRKSYLIFEVFIKCLVRELMVSICCVKTIVTPGKSTRFSLPRHWCQFHFDSTELEVREFDVVFNMSLALVSSICCEKTMCHGDRLCLECVTGTCVTLSQSRELDVWGVFDVSPCCERTRCHEIRLCLLCVNPATRKLDVRKLSYVLNASLVLVSPCIRELDIRKLVNVYDAEKIIRHWNLTVICRLAAWEN